MGLFKLLPLWELVGTSKRLPNLEITFLFSLLRAPRTARQREYQIRISNTISPFKKLPLWDSRGYDGGLGMPRPKGEAAEDLCPVIQL
jgi:hypothetical protein